MSEKLSRGKVNKIFQSFVSVGDGEADDLIKDLLDSHLALYAEIDKMREELETAYQDVKSDYYGSTIARDVAKQLADITGVGK